MFYVRKQTIVSRPTKFFSFGGSKR
jgi:hypothetical protein